MVQSHSLLFGEVMQACDTSHMHGVFLFSRHSSGFSEVATLVMEPLSLRPGICLSSNFSLLTASLGEYLTEKIQGPTGSGALMCFVYQSLGRLLWLTVCPYEDPAKVQPPRSSDLSPSLLPGDVPHPLACLTSILWQELLDWAVGGCLGTWRQTYWT